ncbi:hypothetical protein [Adhaeribacter rhizoryzae]|uniref:histidine kinase n=1 Tax=Adhaeribacter rhizoryzae TaxID=2607907 RepID=A0A5M6DNJ8_9BACT|nr:hypothetical protein [Adhaeribacter rhizoryzae]KAA5549054.1 hypothetical protein F0145_00165 [Adhaeribacter rhizoryzae]
MSEVSYEVLFNSAPVPLIVTDTKGEIKLINEHAVALLDDKMLAFSGLNFCDFIEKSFLKDYIKTDASFSFEDFLEIYQTEHKYWVKSKAGTIIYADIKAVLFESVEQSLYIWTIDPIEISKKLSYELKERVKEQLAILKVVEVFSQYPDTQTALELCLPIIKEGWQYPEVTGVRILLANDEEYITDNFQRTEWLLQAAIKSEKEQYGYLEVCYQQEVPAYGSSIFLYEEERLINILAKLLAIFIERWQAIEKNNADALLLKKITSNIPANTYQFEILPDGHTKMLFINKGNEAFNYDYDYIDIIEDTTGTTEVLYEADKAKVHNAFLEAYKTKKNLIVQYRIIINGIIRWRWLSAIPENTADGKTIWYGASQDITPFVDYVTSVEQILFDISHIIRRPIANIKGISKLLKDIKLTESELHHLSKLLLTASEELDSFIQQLNLSYEEKRKLNQDFQIDFSALVDKRNNFFDARN